MVQLPIQISNSNLNSYFHNIVMEQDSITTQANEITPNVLHITHNCAFRTININNRNFTWNKVILEFNTGGLSPGPQNLEVKYSLEHPEFDYIFLCNFNNIDNREHSEFYKIFDFNYNPSNLYIPFTYKKKNINKCVGLYYIPNIEYSDILYLEDNPAPVKDVTLSYLGKLCFGWLWLSSFKFILEKNNLIKL